MVPHIPIRYTIRRWVVSFMPRSLFPPGKERGTHWIGGWCRPRAWSERCEEEKNHLPLPGIELSLSGRPALGLVNILSYPGLLKLENCKVKSLPRFIDIATWTLFIYLAFECLCRCLFLSLLHDTVSLDRVGLCNGNTSVLCSSPYGATCWPPLDFSVFFIASRGECR
jgi:hypothetical protein